MSSCREFSVSLQPIQQVYVLVVLQTSKLAIDFFDNSFELIELIRQISAETLIVIQLPVDIFQTTPHRHVNMHNIIFQHSL